MKLRMTLDVQKYATILKFSLFLFKQNGVWLKPVLIFQFDGDH
jgi:hypothetical protein